MPNGLDSDLTSAQVTYIQILRYANYTYLCCHEYLKIGNRSVKNSSFDVIANFSEEGSTNPLW